MKNKVFLIVLFIVSHCIQAQGPAQAIRQRIDSIVTAHLTSSELPGISIGVVKDNRIFYLKGYGNSDLKTKKPAGPLTNYHTASISKVFVATAIMQLQEQGRLDINEKLLHYLPGVKIKDKRFKEITVAHMLNHTSGIKDLMNYRWYHPRNDSAALKDYAIRSLHTKLKFNPGEKVRYSNRAYEILGYLIEVLSSKSFEDYLQQNVIGRAGMSRSSFNYYRTEPELRSVPYGRKLISKKIKKRKYYPYNKEHGPSSTLNSCSHDMTKWIIENISLFNDTASEYNGVLKHSTLMRMWTPTYTFKDSVGFVGIGWWGWKSKDKGNWYGHDGGDKGYSSQMMLCPEKQFGFILLSNIDNERGAVYEKIPHDLIELFVKEWQREQK